MMVGGQGGPEQHPREQDGRGCIRQAGWALGSL